EIEVQKLWSSKLGSGAKDYLISLRPSANADTIFAADYDGTVSALDINTGESKWQVNLNAMVTGGVGYGANKVMVGTVEGDVFVLDSANGATLWSSQVSSEILSSPQTNGDIVVVHSIDNQMVALDATSPPIQRKFVAECQINL
ncbi:PQQ-binding-like beta-propeller repeat protein, partial [bacterium]|nr:PQQ-binding-like beta-propeller repeat protein [bacterium]